MSNEVNINKMYQFIASFQKDGSSWSDIADSDYGNDDGTVIKAEFRAFVNGEFANWNGNEGGTVSNDLINQFWKKIDTNTSASKISGTKLKNLNALDKKELATLEKKLEAYVALDEFVATNVIVPAVLTTTGAQWKNAVVSELSALVEKYIQGGCKDDLNAILTEALPAIANQNTAEFCALEYQETLKNGVLAGYPEYDVTTDATLTALLTKFLAGVSADTTAEEIKSEIHSIMDAYLGTAGIGDTESPYDLTELGFDYGKINGIQTAVITQNIKNELSEEAKNYEGYEDEFNAAVQEFIDSKIKEGNDFNYLKNCASEFLNSKFKTNLDTMIEINETYKDVKEGSAFYKELVTRFGESLAEKIAKNDRYIAAYKAIIEDVITKVNAGELSKEEISAYIIDEISKNLEKFFADGLGDMPISELNRTYDNLAAVAEAQKDDDEALKQHREAAIKYCDALVKKSNSLKQAVADAFGSDYKTAINNMYPGDIKDIIFKLKSEALRIGDVTAFKATWSSNIKDFSIIPGSSKAFTPSATITDENGKTKDVNVTYKATITGGGTLTQEGNRFTILAPETSATMTVEIQAIVDGVVIDTKTITVKSEFAQKIDWANTDSTHKVSDMTMYIKGNKIKTTQSLKDMYNNNTSIVLSEGHNDANTARSESISTLQNLVNLLVTAGKNNGGHEDALKTAAEKTMALYSEAIYGFVGAGKKTTTTQKVTDENNISYSYTVRTWYYTSTAYGDGEIRDDKASNNQLGLQINKKYHNTDRLQMVINMTCLMDIFNRFYEQALQS